MTILKLDLLPKSGRWSNVSNWYHELHIPPGVWEHLCLSGIKAPCSKEGQQHTVCACLRQQGKKKGEAYTIGYTDIVSCRFGFPHVTVGLII